MQAQNPALGFNLETWNFYQLANSSE